VGTDAEVSAMNAVAEDLPDTAVHSIIAALNTSCKHMAQFLQLLEYSRRSTWYLDACGGARLKLRRGQRRSQHIAGRTETCRGSNSVVNLVLEDLDEPLNPENEGGSFKKRNISQHSGVRTARF
jgi:hypothetical protein